jgi:hypothetical protein
MHSKMKLSVAALIALLVSACSTPVQSRVAVFHQLPATFSASSSFVVVPWRDDQKDSLEFATYASQMTSLLTLKGMQVADADSKPRYAVIFDFGIDDGRRETTSYSLPVFGVTGSAGSTTTATVNQVGNSAYVNATTTNIPTYGITGYQQGTVNSTVFSRFVNVDILELDPNGASPKKVYEGRVKSEGWCGNLSILMPVFLHSLLDEFPGKSGAARTVSLPTSSDC